MMNGSLRVIVDTNILYGFFYNPFGDSGKLMLEAINKKIELYSPDVIYEEMRRLLVKNLKLSAEEANHIADALPVNWVEREIYQDSLDKARIIKHKSDRPLLALALTLKCGLLSYGNHLKPAGKYVKLWKMKDLLKESERHR